MSQSPATGVWTEGHVLVSDEHPQAIDGHRHDL